MADMKDVKKLDEGKLEEVAGGFVQMFPGASYGEKIICPGCGNEDQSEFTCDGDILADVGKDLYICCRCGKKFAVATFYGVTDIIN